MSRIGRTVVAPESKIKPFRKPRGNAMELDRQLARSQDISTKVSMVFQKRMKIAQEQLTQRLKEAGEANLRGLSNNPAAAPKAWMDWYSYAVDGAQRSILFWDTMRQR